MANKNLIAYCGLYCGQCKKYLEKKCAGCHENVKATWCKIRSCCIENKYLTCADCKTFSEPMACKKFNNIFSKFFALVFKSDRNGCIAKIKADGLEKFAQEMEDKKEMTMKK